ncbi:MAG: polysaccharide deacetylase family protein [Planctomycetota bacterium]|nr:polysaccharide deacetylase family protein [Planctomycetota bacterium]
MKRSSSSSDAAFRWPEGRRAALSFSFDDARASQVDVGIPILDRHGVKATFYVMLYNVEPRLAQWKAALAAGHEIGNHSLRHPCSANFGFARDSALEDYTLADIEAEIVEANARLQELLGQTPRTFAYPCGQTFVGRGAGCASYVPVVARHFLAGRGFLSEPFNNPALCDLAQLCGAPSDDLSFAELRRRTEAILAEGGWLIFCGHEVGQTGGQTTRSEALEEFCAYVTDPARGLWVDTVAAVAEYVRDQRGKAND